jgi:hypothetical protein
MWALLPPTIDNKAREPKVMIDQIKVLQDLGLEATHCIEEFIRCHIRPLGHKKSLAFACPCDIDLSHNPRAQKLASFG